MKEPSDGVPEVLLPHVHLVSSFNYPKLNFITPEVVVDHLKQAPAIVRHTAPMYWTFLDAPTDGTILMVWQSQQSDAFPTDGYLYTDIEEVMAMEVRGYTLVAYVHRSGFIPGKEHVATHSRRRYRITSSGQAQAFDRSLWLVHYASADPSACMPVARLTFAPHVQQTLNMRRYLMSQGQLVRKDFMLHDRNNWPAVTMPSGGANPAGFPPGQPMGGGGGGGGGGGAMPPGMARAGAGGGGGMLHPAFHAQQQMAQQHAQLQQQKLQQQQQQQAAHGPAAARVAAGHHLVEGGPPAAKRARTMAHNPPPGTVALAPPGHAAGHDADGGGALFDVPEDDDAVEESFDSLSLRDVAAARYQRQHDLMAEVLASPYAIEELRPVDLDLNRVIHAALTVLEDDAPPPREGGGVGGGKGGVKGRVPNTAAAAGAAASKKDAGTSAAANANTPAAAAAAAAPATAGTDKAVRPPASGNAQPAAAATGPASSILARAQAERKSLVARAQAALDAFPAQKQRMEEEHAATVKAFRDRCTFWAEAERRLRNAEWDPDASLFSPSSASSSSFLPTAAINTTTTTSVSVTTPNAAVGAAVAESLLHSSKGVVFRTQQAAARDDSGSGSGGGDGGENVTAAAAAKVERVADVIRDVERATRKQVYARDEVVLIHSGGLGAEHPYLPRFLARYPAGRHQIPTLSPPTTITTTATTTTTTNTNATTSSSSGSSSSLAAAKAQPSPLFAPPPPLPPLPDDIEVNL